ncbi:efflux RND transporter periplasmic adaptor subunit [Alloyangia pacifica]|uniref:Membrane fusion protein, macrolide-specific efflux system n=1 Tax=Alloyangia pacifica TaxID=311180 RepID=A0A1I6RDX8_9RHOB|nr:efflux RND transporter periplasmic adaptor subunit [Alloyangia pacifica]SDG47292.1 membrane fusion protein, macrolide-specific efflux system [Alloyangia pacifica]SFS62688.1 membrane fusion protein, macrolide-specific efflux system [Alloyangia pacifica]
MSIRKTGLIIGVLTLIGAGAGWAYLDRTSEPAQAAPQTVAVTRATVSSTVLATGLIEATDLVSVGARTSGLIEELAVEVGSDVAQGDLIARIDSLEQQNSVAQAKAELAQIEAEIDSQTAEIRQAELDLERQQGLNAKKLSATSELEAAEATLAMTRAGLQSLEAQQARAEIAVSSAELDLERTKITAPIDGTVVAVVNGEGTTVNASQEAPTIVKLAQLDRMEVKAEISEADVVNVQPGQEVEFTLLGAPDLTYTATLASVEPAPSSIKDSDEIDTDSAIYYNARFTVDNDDRLLRIGMSADVTIFLGRAEDVPTLPLSLLPAKGRDGLYRIEVPGTGDQPEFREIKIGLKDATRFEILSGLEAGEQVISTGAAPAPATAGSTRSSGGRGGPPPMMGL